MKETCPIRLKEIVGSLFPQHEPSNWLSDTQGEPDESMDEIMTVTNDEVKEP